MAFIELSTVGLTFCDVTRAKVMNSRLVVLLNVKIFINFRLTVQADTFTCWAMCFCIFGFPVETIAFFATSLERHDAGCCFRGCVEQPAQAGSTSLFLFNAALIPLSETTNTRRRKVHCCTLPNTLTFSVACLHWRCSRYSDLISTSYRMTLHNVSSISGGVLEIFKLENATINVKWPSVYPWIDSRAATDYISSKYQLLSLITVL
jgi:hypothetical protein